MFYVKEASFGTKFCKITVTIVAIVASDVYCLESHRRLHSYKKWHSCIYGINSLREIVKWEAMCFT